jgi:hypothetical protein
MQSVKGTFPHRQWKAVFAAFVCAKNVESGVDVYVRALSSSSAIAMRAFLRRRASAVKMASAVDLCPRIPIGVLLDPKTIAHDMAVFQNFRMLMLEICTSTEPTRSAEGQRSIPVYDAELNERALEVRKEVRK